MFRFTLTAIRCFITLVMLAANATVYAEDYPEFPFHKKMDVLVVASDMNVNGVPMRAFTFKTSENEDSVVEFYKNEWGEEMTDVLFGDWRILSHRDGDYLLTVQIEQGGHMMTHGTLGITPAFRLAESSVRKIKAIQSKVGEDFPTLPGTNFINDITADDAGRRTRTLFFSNKNSVAQNVRYYLKTFRADGWVLLGPGTDEKKKGDAAAFGMNRAGEEINLSFVRRDGLTYGVAVKLQ